MQNVINIQFSHFIAIIPHSKTTNQNNNISYLCFHCFPENITSTIQHYMENIEADQQNTNDGLAVILV